MSSSTTSTCVHAEFMASMFLVVASGSLDSITVVIRPNDKIEIDGLTVDPRAVSSQIVRRKAENPKASIAVLAHSKSRANTLVVVVDAIKDAGFEDSVPINELKE